MLFERGAVVLVLFPNSNLSTAKRRPALIVQANKLTTGLSQSIVAMISSNLARANHPSRIFIDINTSEAVQMGLLASSVIMTDNLATIRHKEIDRKIGFLSDMGDVDLALRHTFGL
jgi:mRNA interferase MazF